MAKAAPKKSTEELYAWDAEKRGSGLLLCGVDEAGRGPLAGDVYAAAVILDPSKPLIAGLNDSKKMTEKMRNLSLQRCSPLVWRTAWHLQLWRRSRN